MWTDNFAFVLLLGFKDKSTDKLAGQSVKPYHKNLVVAGYKLREEMKYYLPSFKTDILPRISIHGPHIFIGVEHFSNIYGILKLFRLPLLFPSLRLELAPY